MGLGSTAKKIQTVANAVEEIYAKTNEMVDNVVQLREDFETTSQRVERMETELEEQRALLEAIAQAEDVDVEALLEEEPEVDGETPAGGPSTGESADRADGEEPVETDGQTDDGRASAED